MKPNTTPVVKDLVLIGGGHAHVGVLYMLAMKPVLGLRITLIARDIHTPYSGMLPGLIAGHYSYDETHIDLARIARFCGARIYHAEVEGIDLDNKKVIAKGRPPISYDLLSINTGSRPSTVGVKGADEFALAVKPIDIFLQHWERLLADLKSHKGDYHLAIVGGGAGGVEMALCTQYKLQADLKALGKTDCNIHISLLTRDETVMSNHNAGVRRRFERVLKERNIDFYSDATVVEVGKDFVRAEDGLMLSTDAVIWVTTAGAPEWPKQSGLQVDDNGFIKANEYLQNPGNEDIFVAGDVASLYDPRPKSGVFAVRQGPILAHNLRAAATAKKLRKYKPQREFLGLISTGDKYAVASRSNWSFEGAWLWTIKDWIDRRFMQRFDDLPEMPEDQAVQLADGIADSHALQELSTLAMRCGGCGAKVGATVLSRVMQRLPQQRRDDVVIGRDAPDDSAMLAVPAGKLLVQSVDYFRAFMDDNYTFGAIAANHALGDVFAMGAEAQSVLAIATVPYGREAVVEESLYELLAGAMSVIEPTGAVLSGGHSSEGAELAFGLTVNGLVSAEGVWRKGGMKPGDKLILTKAVGTGTLLAADMRYKAKGRWVMAAIESMLQSSQAASECLRNFKTSACTDVTGFGLVGHLLEMLRASENTGAVLNLDAIPVLDGALDTVKAGILSTLQPANLRLRRAVANIEDASKHPNYPLMFDPQTAGGLLAAVDANDAEACVEQLRLAGYEKTVIIGEVIADSSETPIQLI